MMLLVLACCAGLAVAAARDFTDAEYHRMPRLFHLDDYDRCLARPGGLYCTGSFRLSARQPTPVYELMKEYSADPLHFNHTLLHRGYCVSERCPSSQGNSSQRFERCVQRYAFPQKLQATLGEHYCQQHGRRNFKEIPTVYLEAYVWVVLAILLLNLIGTLYDYAEGGNGKNRILLAWSVRANWGRLTTHHEEHSRAAIAPIQGFRIVMLLLVIACHAAEINYKIYSRNPVELEKLVLHPMTMIFRNGTSMVQSFVVLSNFLLAYNILNKSKQHQPGLRDLPFFILNRIARLAPVHMFMVGFAATWWARLGGGPQWAATVGAEAATCRRKFTLHALFLHNLQDADQYCLMQTWFIAVDFQLFVIASAVMLTLLHKKWRPLPVLSALFIASCLINALLAYINGWQSLVYAMSPDHIRETFRHVQSFRAFYITPWGSLPACFVGLLLGHVQFYIQERGIKITEYKLVGLCYRLILPLSLAWVLAGLLVQHRTSRFFSAFYVAVERPGYALLSAVCFLGLLNNMENWMWKFFSWRGWQALSRMSLSVLMLHWCINKSIVASRHTLTEFSVISIISDGLWTFWWSAWLAVPLTVLVEYPAQKTFSALFL